MIYKTVARRRKQSKIFENIETVSAHRIVKKKETIQTFQDASQRKLFVKCQQNKSEHAPLVLHSKYFLISFFS